LCKSFYSTKKSNTTRTKTEATEETSSKSGPNVSEEDKVVKKKRPKTEVLSDVNKNSNSDSTAKVPKTNNSKNSKSKDKSEPDAENKKNVKSKSDTAEKSKDVKNTDSNSTTVKKSTGKGDKPAENKEADPMLQQDTMDVVERLKNVGDITWYRCQPISESQLLHTISLTDSGVRVSAMLLVCRLCQADWRLRMITAYHVQTALLHEADYALDATPRWQRNSLERCTRAILHKLLGFARMRQLPHFFLHDVDLWQDQGEDKMALALSALERLSTSDMALTSLVCRTGGFSMSTDTDLGFYANLISERSETKPKHRRL